MDLFHAILPHMNLHILAIGKKKTTYDTMINEYTKRIGKPWAISFEILEPLGLDHPEQSRIKETEKLISKIKPDDRVIVLDEHGKDMTTRAFADQLDHWMNQGIKRVVLVIGGSYGMDMALWNSVPHTTLRLGAMTLPHEMVRLIITEQCYRATNLLQGGKYHHE
jgi:23S rRNA (pseudouridine1915-N3)-methyltransferase